MLDAPELSGLWCHHPVGSYINQSSVEGQGTPERIPWYRSYLVGLEELPGEEPCLGASGEPGMWELREAGRHRSLPGWNWE